MDCQERQAADDGVAWWLADGGRSRGTPEAEYVVDDRSMAAGGFHGVDAVSVWTWSVPARLGRVNPERHDDPAFGGLVGKK